MKGVGTGPGPTGGQNGYTGTGHGGLIGGIGGADGYGRIVGLTGQA